MNKYFIAIFCMLTGLLSAAAHAAPGEYWEVTSKMEMPGMPFAMPATTQKVCIAKGAEKNPEKTSGDKDCKMTDVKTVGNKTTWKARCDRDGEVMTGVGEQTSGSNAYQGKIKLSGNDMSMTMQYSGKRIGGSCDTGEAGKAMNEEHRKIISQVCDEMRGENTATQISGADAILLPNATCAAERNQFCDRVRREAPKDAKTYNAVLMHDQQTGSNVSVAKECKLNMAATTKSICKTLNGSNYSDLSRHCPAEAKKYREVQRRKDCEGRAYTAETRAADIKKCLSGKSDDEGASGEDASSQKSGSSPASEALEAAKKLRSKFGF